MEHAPRSPPMRRDSRSPPPARSRSRSRSPIDDRSRQDRGDINPGNNLYIKNLHPVVNERQLEELFSKYGKVSKCQIMLDPHTRQSRGFGFVTLEHTNDAEDAIKALDGQDFEGRILAVEKARRGRARTPTPGRYNGPNRSDHSFRNGFRDSRPYDRPRYDDRRGGYGSRRDDDRYRRDDRRDYDRRDDRYSDRRDYDRRDDRRDDRDRRDYRRDDRRDDRDRR